MKEAARKVKKLVFSLWQELLQKMSQSHFPWGLLVFFFTSVFAAIVIYDIVSSPNIKGVCVHVCSCVCKGTRAYTFSLCAYVHLQLFIDFCLEFSYPLTFIKWKVWYLFSAFFQSSAILFYEMEGMLSIQLSSFIQWKVCYLFSTFVQSSAVFYKMEGMLSIQCFFSELSYPLL